jgi:O-antigen/teichoic acid export membrane protein
LLVAQNYVWCAEKAKLGVLPVFGGLAMNIAVNLFLVPAWGLLGAVVSTTIATGSALVMMYWVNRRAGMRLDVGMVLLSVAPAALGAGAWCATAAFLVLAATIPFSRTLFTQVERDLFTEFGQSYLRRLSTYLSPTRKQGEASHVV